MEKDPYLEEIVPIEECNREVACEIITRHEGKFITGSTLSTNLHGEPRCCFMGWAVRDKFGALPRVTVDHIAFGVEERYAEHVELMNWLGLPPRPPAESRDFKLDIIDGIIEVNDGLSYMAEESSQIEARLRKFFGCEKEEEAS